MPKLPRAEIHRRALRAALAVATSVGIAACGPVPDDRGEETYGAQAALPPPGEDLEDAGDADFDAGAGAVVADAGAPHCHDAIDKSAEAWLACCDDIGWDWSRGCEAWGPPAPPVMPRLLVQKQGTRHDEEVASC